MERFIRNDADFKRLFNCSFYNISKIPLEERVNVPLGTFWLTVCSVETALYLLCLVAIWQNRKSSCFKIMTAMGVVAIPSLLYYAINGWFQIVGAVFCSSRKYFYITGCMNAGSWVMDSTLELLLAFNRCLNFVSPTLSQRLFGSEDGQSGHRTWIWIAVCVFYGCCYILYGKPYFFSAKDGGMYWTPHWKYADDMLDEYINAITWQSIQCVLLSTCMPLLYMVFGWALLYQQKEFISGDHQSSYSQKMIFLQISLIALVNFLCASTSIINTFIRSLFTSKIYPTLLFIQYGTQVQTHGLAPIIYLTLNRKLRADIRKNLKVFVEKAREISVNSRQSRLGRFQATVSPQS